MKPQLLLAHVCLAFVVACGGSSPPAGGDAQTPGEPCADEGAMRAGDCGNCGMVSERCTGGFWVTQGACIGEGPCAPGTNETGTLPYCGEEQRLCGNDCQWSDWAVTVPGTGDCDPGEQRFQQEDCGSGMFRRQECSSTCAWVTQPDACVDECGDLPRDTGEEDEAEECVPAGPFIRGLAGQTYAEPVATVTLSPYYMDRYSVTNRRYKACYDAGMCGLPTESWAQDSLLSAATATHPVSALDWDDAMAFCNWDGARRLTTEAEYEKAARGPAPRDNKYVWDGPDWRCDLLTVQGCPSFVPLPPTAVTPAEPYYANSGDTSYYGVRGLMGSGPVWNLDFFDADYYADPSSLVDPLGPPTGDYHTIRGEWRYGIGVGTQTVSRRWAGTSPSWGVRCGRSAPGI